MPPLLVGCCGFAESQQRYFAEFNAVEVQQTFYDPPRPETAARWPERAGPDFHFAIKAWQAITHEPSSPTYRRIRTCFSARALARLGSFRPTQQVAAAWRRTVEVALAMRAEIVLLQCPASFAPTARNLANLRQFLERAGRHGLRLAWEPRGQWPADLVAGLCQELNLVHAFDPFQGQYRVPETGPRYFRLHGVDGPRYRHTKEDLWQLAAWVGCQPAYVFFNNLAMLEDARRFRDLISRQQRG